MHSNLTVPDNLMLYIKWDLTLCTWILGANRHSNLTVPDNLMLYSKWNLTLCTGVMFNRKRILMPDLTGLNLQGNRTVPDILMLYIKQDSTLCKECTWVTVEQREMAEDRGRKPYEQLYEPGTSGIGSMELLFSEEARERDTPGKVEDSGSELGDAEDRTEDREMETEGGRPNLGTTFYQCRAAREAKLTETVFDLTT
jgi:hypothetical protein